MKPSERLRSLAKNGVPSGWHDPALLHTAADACEEIETRPPNSQVMSPAQRVRAEKRLAELHEHLLGNTTDGPFGDFHCELFKLTERARKAGDEVTARALAYCHDLFCNVRKNISADPKRVKLPPRPVFVRRQLPPRVRR